MVNPVELIGKARSRIARIAAFRAALLFALPVVVTLAIAFALEPIGALTWQKLGYVLNPATTAAIRKAIFGLGLAELLLLAGAAWRAYRAANDFVGAAAQIDELVRGHQEIVTLAMLADPSRPQSRRERTALFPMLWRRVISYLDLFEPSREFRMELAKPLGRSSILALAVVIALGIATMALVRPPTPTEALARHLRQIAREMQATANPANHAFAAAALKAAADLENPKLPPEQKLTEIGKIEHEIEKNQQQQPQQESAQNGSSSGNSSGSGKSNGEGKGSGARNSTGNGAGKGSGSGQGADTSKNGKNKNNQTAELRNEIANAQAQIQAGSEPRDKSKGGSSGNQKDTGARPEPGSNPNKTGQQNQSNGNAAQMPRPDNTANNKMPSGNGSSGQKNDKGSSGDTHMGEFPKAENFQRFIKPGDKGPPIEIRDARYVRFRLPPTIPANDGTGALVPDTERPTASAPYTNAPLKQQRLAVTPDEQQLMPPRYRDLIR
ncbi:MAG: hypothetical protein ACREQN_13835 [Candidatus Binataceae bacterium]